MGQVLQRGGANLVFAILGVNGLSGRTPEVKAVLQHATNTGGPWVDVHQTTVTTALILSADGLVTSSLLLSGGDRPKPARYIRLRLVSVGNDDNQGTLMFGVI